LQSFLAFSVQLFSPYIFSVSRHMVGGLDHCKALLFVTYLLMRGWGQQEEMNALVTVRCYSNALPVVTRAVARHLEPTH